MTAIHFAKADIDNIELVRQVVLRRLRDRKWDQLGDNWDDREVKNYITFESPPAKSRFLVLMQEVMWNLIVQGVVTPGKDASNCDLPWFRVTDYGRRVLEDGRLVPHDPSGYLSEVESIAGPAMTKSALPYVREALRCFTSGCNVAATMMLGIAAEAVFLDLCAAIAKALKDPSERKAFEQIRFVKKQHRWIVDKYNKLNPEQRKRLPESLDTTLTALYDLVRKQRNDIGHPSAVPVDINRDKAFCYFLIFPTLVADLRAFSSYCRKHKI
jgi:hypothetical protein